MVVLLETCNGHPQERLFQLTSVILKDSKFKSCKKINLNKINKNEMEEKISKTKGCLFNEISFLLGLVFIKNIKFI